MASSVLLKITVREFLKKAILVFKFLLVFAWAGLFGLVLATPPSLLWFIIVILPLIVMWIGAYVTYSVSGHEPHTQAVKRHLWLANFQRWSSVWPRRSPKRLSSLPFRNARPPTLHLEIGDVSRNVETAHLGAPIEPGHK